MNGFYYALEIIKNQLEIDNDVNVVNTGIVEDILLKKKDIYPYSHIFVNSATLNGSTWTVNYSVTCMDIVDISKEQTTDMFRGQNNAQDVLNTQFLVINRVLEVLRRGENTHLYQLDGSPNCEIFHDRFEHGVAGWTCTFDLLIPNEMTVCDNNVTPITLCPSFNYTITDADSNVLYTGDILSGDSLVQLISSATVTNSLSTVLGNILAQGNLELPDVNNINSDGSTVPTPAGVAFTCSPVAPCIDATAVLKDTAGTTISTTPIASGASSNITAPDASYTVRYDDLTPIQSGSIVSGGSVLVEVPTPTAGGFTDMKLLPRDDSTNHGTGDQPTRGRATDFFTLNYTNEWGHNFRFCGITGGYTDSVNYYDVDGVSTTRALAFPSSIICDFTSRNETEILSYYIGDSTTYRGYTTALPLHVSSTFGGLTA
jgi:hypothetical protein